MQPRQDEMRLFLEFTTSYMMVLVLMCNTHDVAPLDVESAFDTSAGFDKAVRKAVHQKRATGLVFVVSSTGILFL
jgi:hypothetical protein